MPVSLKQMFVFSLTLGLGLFSDAEEPEAIVPTEEIAGLIQQLDDPRFAVREAASVKLLDIGEPAREQLEVAARTHASAEVRRRTAELIEALNTARRLASGVHVVALYEASPKAHFRGLDSPAHRVDWEALGAALVAHRDRPAPNPGKRIWLGLSEEAQEIAQDESLCQRMNAEVERLRWRGGDKDAEASRASLRLGISLTTVVERRDFYQARAFDGLELDEEVQQLLDRRKELSPLELVMLNWRLFEAVFPEAVQPMEFDLARATVPVRVVATEKPITLVLCSHESILWDLQLDEGANIERVIVSGYRFQGVKGTDAPVTYRMYDRFVTEAREGDYFFAYKADDEEEYAKVVEGVRDLTGKEIATFQGRYRYQDGPPIVVGEIP